MLDRLGDALCTGCPSSGLNIAFRDYDFSDADGYGFCGAEMTVVTVVFGGTYMVRSSKLEHFVCKSSMSTFLILR